MVTYLQYVGAPTISPLFTGRNVVSSSGPATTAAVTATVQNANRSLVRASNSLAPKTRGCRVPGVVLSYRIQNPLRSAKHPAVCPGRARRRPHSTAHHARFHHYLRPVLLTSTPTHQSKPIAHAPCSGSVQYIFSSPARLPSRFLSAYAYCRRATELKMLCNKCSALAELWRSKVLRTSAPRCCWRDATPGA
jgi:hypothetical protein